MTRAELIAALEAAEGPSRELDLAIAELAGYRRVHPTERPATWFRPDGTFCGLAPAFTDSLDAAMILLPEGWWWVLNSGLSAHGVATAIIACEGKSSLEKFEKRGRTPALALCIAALTAQEP